MGKRADMGSDLIGKFGGDLQDLVESVATLTDSNTLSGNLIANAGFVLGLQTVVAAGSDQAGAGAITAQGGAVVLCSTADNTKGIRLPVLSSVSVGEVYIIMNNLSNKTLEVYPGSGDAINPVSDNGAVTIAADTMLICIAQDAVQSAIEDYLNKKYHKGLVF